MKKFGALSFVFVISVLVSACGADSSRAEGSTVSTQISSVEVSVWEEESSQEIFVPEENPVVIVDDSTTDLSSAGESETFADISPSSTGTQNTVLREIDQVSEQDVLNLVGEEKWNTIVAMDNTPVTWGPGINSQGERPTAPEALQKEWGESGAIFLGAQTPKIYLTFDEGYEVGYTAAILDTLKEKGVHAVFFVTLPYVKSQPDLIQRMIAEGHIVGNHSTTHPVGGLPTMNPMDCAKDILTLDQYMKENFGYTMTLCRPPEGTFSPRTLAVLDALGYDSVFWSFAYKDWDTQAQPDPTEALQTITSREHEGAVYLLHAVSKTNTQVLGSVIDQMQQDGYVISDWDIS